MITRDEIITLAESLAFSLDEAGTLDTFMNDVFNELGLSADPPLIKAEIKALTSGIATYAFESDMLQLTHAIMHDELLSPSSEAMFAAYSQSWRADSGTPFAFTQDKVDARNYTLYPGPDFSSSPLIPAHGEPFGEDFPLNSLVLIYADNREQDIPDIFSLPTAFDALRREFSYPSDHADEAFANACEILSNIFYTLLGVK